MAQVCTPHTWEVEAVKLEVQGKCWLRRELESNLGSRSSGLKDKQQTNDKITNVYTVSNSEM